VISVTRQQQDAARHIASDQDRRVATPWAWLVALTLVAMAVRAIGLNSGLWIDEMYSLVDSIRPPLWTILTRFAGDTQHPLYMPLAHLSIEALGEHPWSVRLPAMLFGVASVPMLYALGALVANRREALLAAGLLAVSYHHVWFSQNARGYSMLAFWAMLSTYCLIRAVREQRPGFYAGFAVAAALGVYTHLTMVFVVLGQALACAWLLARRDPNDAQLRDWKTPLAAFASAGVFTVLLYAPILGQVQDFFLNRPSQLRGASTPTWALLETIQVLRVGFGGLGLLGALVFAGGIIIAGCGVASYVRQSRFIALLFILPGIVTLLGAMAARGTLYPRFFFFLAGFAVVVGVRGATVAGAWIAGRILRNRLNEAVVGTMLAGAMIGVSVLSLPYGWRYPKQDFEGAMGFVEAQRAANDAVATAGMTSYAYRQFYGRPWESVESARQLEALRARSERVWLLYTLPRYIERANPELMALVKRDCRVVRVFHGTLSGGDVTVCRLEALNRRDGTTSAVPASARAAVAASAGTSS